MINMEELKKDLLDYDLYYLLDDVEYGDYQLSIFNEGEKIIIAVYDNWGSAVYVMNREEFLSIDTTEELEEYINNVIYYNYIEYDQ